MGGFVVMPNHVHILVVYWGVPEIESQCRSWKKFTAGRINRILGKAEGSGRKRASTIWCEVRSNLQHYGSYIAENPNGANLRAGEFFHYIRPSR